jgi:hypothetical protein
MLLPNVIAQYFILLVGYDEYTRCVILMLLVCLCFSRVSEEEKDNSPLDRKRLQTRSQHTKIL